MAEVGRGKGKSGCQSVENLKMLKNEPASQSIEGNTNKEEKLENRP